MVEIQDYAVVSSGSWLQNMLGFAKGFHRWIPVQYIIFYLDSVKVLLNLVEL